MFQDREDRGRRNAAMELQRGRLRATQCRRQANKRADGYRLVRSLGRAVLLERYLERELDLAFRLGRAGKEAEVGIRYSVVGLRRTLKRAKSSLIPGVEEVRSKDDSSSLFAEWKHLFQRQVRIGDMGRSKVIPGLISKCVGSRVREARLLQVLHASASVIRIRTQAVRSFHHVAGVLQIIVTGIVVEYEPGMGRVNTLETPPSNDFVEQGIGDIKSLPSAKRQLIDPAKAEVLRKIVSRNTPVGTQIIGILHAASF